MTSMVDWKCILDVFCVDMPYDSKEKPSALDNKIYSVEIIEMT